MVARIFSVADVAAAQGNTSLGINPLGTNTTDNFNTANGFHALVNNNEGIQNTASGVNALPSNTTGGANTPSGNGANVTFGNLTIATAIGSNAFVDASNKIRLGSGLVTVIKGQVAFTASSDKTK